MLVRSDPFRDLDRLTQQMFGTLGSTGTPARPTAMPMDAWRDGDEFIIEFDLPGLDPSAVDLDVERNVLTVKAERPPLDGGQELLAAERPRGTFSRQLVLGDNLDIAQVRASYQSGVLTLRIPVAERAKPRRIEINTESDDRKAIQV